MVAGVLLPIMLGIAVIASGTLFHYPDHADAGVSEEAFRRLKAQAALPYDGWHPRTLQIIAPRVDGPTPGHVRGSVPVRSLSGIPVGAVVIGPLDWHLQFDGSAWTGAWSGSILLQGMVGGCTLWRARRT